VVVHSRPTLEGMNTKLLLTLAILLAGVWGAWIAGKRSKCGWGGGLAIAFAVVAALFILVNIGIAGCVSAKLCVSGGDTDLSYVAYPVFAFPIYWVLARLAASVSKGSS